MEFYLQNRTLFLKGSLDYKTSKKELKGLARLASKAKSLDLSALSSLDYAGAFFLSSHCKNLELINTPKNFSHIIDFTHFTSFEISKNKRLNVIEYLGKILINLKIEAINIINFTGAMLLALLSYIIMPWRIRLRELSNNIKTAGINAIFIVCLTSFLIGIVLAYQGAVMLERFGASVLVVDIMGIITLREIAPLIAAIVVAGRSASSFAAQIGVMKITEELHAMTTMGFAPFVYVVMPRILALILSMPVIILWADFVSIFGQMCVCDWYLNLDFESYLRRFSQNVDIRHFIVGMIKAPIFGAVIAIIGCFRGYEVDGSTESVGKQTTKSVVNAIFWIIALDAAFSVIFTELGI